MVAEIGKVKDLPVTELKAGMKVQKDVIGYGGKVLVNAGEILSQKHVNQLNKWEGRQQPQGPVIAKSNPKDRNEPIRRSTAPEKWKVSHFNPYGIRVSNTLATGDLNPAVEQNIELSPRFQKETPRTSFSTGSINIPSPLERSLELRSEIKMLEGMNSELGGHLWDDSTNYAGESELLNRKINLLED